MAELARGTKCLGYENTLNLPVAVNTRVIHGERIVGLAIQYSFQFPDEAVGRCANPE